MAKHQSIRFEKTDRYGKHRIEGFNSVAFQVEILHRTGLATNAAYTTRAVGLEYMNLVRKNLEEGLKTAEDSYPDLSSETVKLKNKGRGSARPGVSKSKYAEMPWMESGDFAKNALGFFDEAGREIPLKEVITWLKKKRVGNVKIGYGVPLDKVRENNPGANQIQNYATLAYILEYGASKSDIPARPIFAITLRSDKLREKIKEIKTHSLRVLVDSWENAGREKPNYFIENRIKKYFDTLIRVEDNK